MDNRRLVLSFLPRCAGGLQAKSHGSGGSPAQPGKQDTRHLVDVVAKSLNKVSGAVTF